MKNIQGYTLIELMVVMALVGIMTGYAIVSYSQHRETQNANIAKVEMQNLQIQLQEYKATNLTYKGFPTTSESVYLDPSARSPKKIYEISVVDLDNGVALNSNAAIGNDWAIKATPDSKTNPGNNIILVNSQGVQCMNKKSDIVTYKTCGTTAQNSTSW